MKSVGETLAALSTQLAPTCSGSYWEMDDTERRAYYQRKADRSNAEMGHLHERDGIDCPVCRNKGVVYCVQETVNPASEVTEISIAMRKCKCNAARVSSKRLRDSGLQNLIEKCTFEKFVSESPWQAELKRLAMEFVERAERMFFVGGQSGCGKTHICTAITVELINRNRAAYYMLWADEVVKIKAAAMDAAARDAMINRIKDVDVLYIDDFLKPVGENRTPTDADIRLAYEIINHRYNKGNQITIISSERTIGELLEIDEATGGRIVEYAGPYMVNIGRDSRRNYRLRRARGG